MDRIRIKEVLSYTEFVLGEYKSADRQRYEVMYATHFTCKKVGERRELIAVQQHGTAFAPGQAVWLEIEAHLNEALAHKQAA